MHPLETQLQCLEAEIRQLRARAARGGEVIVDERQLLEMGRAVEAAEAAARELLGGPSVAVPLELART